MPKRVYYIGPNGGGVAGPFNAPMVATLEQIHWRPVSRPRFLLRAFTDWIMYYVEAAASAYEEWRWERERRA